MIIGLLRQIVAGQDKQRRCWKNWSSTSAPSTGSVHRIGAVETGQSRTGSPLPHRRRDLARVQNEFLQNLTDEID
jgi:hypothetical protein